MTAASPVRPLFHRNPFGKMQKDAVGRAPVHKCNFTSTRSRAWFIVNHFNANSLDALNRLSNVRRLETDMQQAFATLVECSGYCTLILTHRAGNAS